MVFADKGGPGQKDVTVYITPLDEHGNPTGDRVALETMWLNIDSGYTVTREVTALMSDGHPDALVVSSEYYDLQSGWYVIDGTVRRHGYTTNPHEMRFRVTVVSDVHTYKPAMWSVYHHPSLDYIREVARQITAGARKVYDDTLWPVPQAVIHSLRIGRWTGTHVEPVSIYTGGAWTHTDKE